MSVVSSDASRRSNEHAVLRPFVPDGSRRVFEVDKFPIDAFAAGPTAGYTFEADADHFNAPLTVIFHRDLPSAATRARKWFGERAVFTLIETDEMPMTTELRKLGRLLALPKSAPRSSDTPRFSVIPWDVGSTSTAAMRDAVATCVVLRHNAVVIANACTASTAAAGLGALKTLLHNLGDSVILLSDSTCCAGRDIPFAVRALCKGVSLSYSSEHDGEHDGEHEDGDGDDKEGDNNSDSTGGSGRRTQSPAPWGGNGDGGGSSFGDDEAEPVPAARRGAGRSARAAERSTARGTRHIRTASADSAPAPLPGGARRLPPFQRAGPADNRPDPARGASFARAPLLPAPRSPTGDSFGSASLGFRGVASGPSSALNVNPASPQRGPALPDKMPAAPAPAPQPRPQPQPQVSLLSAVRARGAELLPRVPAPRFLSRVPTRSRSAATAPPPQPPPLGLSRVASAAAAPLARRDESGRVVLPPVSPKVSPSRPGRRRFLLAGDNPVLGSPTP